LAAFLQELLGNTHLLSKTASYLTAKASSLIELVTDPDRMAQEMAICSLKQLKCVFACEL